MLSPSRKSTALGSSPMKTLPVYRLHSLNRATKLIEGAKESEMEKGRERCKSAGRASGARPAVWLRPAPSAALGAAGGRAAVGGGGGGA